MLFAAYGPCELVQAGRTHWRMIIGAKWFDDLRYRQLISKGPKMNRTMIALAIFALVSRTAAGDEIRRAALPAALLGTWGESSENCTTKDKSNVVMESAKYGDASGSCAVRWVVETASPQGTNYAVHALCASAKDPTKTETVNIIIRPQGDDRASMGRSFQGLKTYQHCPSG
jgi:hypothetical protein